MTLPSYLFIDKYAFSDPLFLDSHHLRALRSIAGETDLEAPDWVVGSWGSASLFEIQHPSLSATAGNHSPGGKWNVTIPLHLRYLPPNRRNGGVEVVDVPAPVVFWACHGEVSGSKMAVNPFDRVNLGFDGLFGDRTVFYHVPAVPKVGGGEIVEKLRVPVLDLDAAEAWGMSLGTVVVVGLGSLVVAWWLVRIMLSGRSMDVRKVERKEGKKEQ